VRLRPPLREVNNVYAHPIRLVGYSPVRRNSAASPIAAGSGVAHGRGDPGRRVLSPSRLARPGRAVGHVVGTGAQARALAGAERRLKGEQLAAFQHVTAAPDVAAMVGFAGTGKSTMLGAKPSQPMTQRDLLDRKTPMISGTASASLTSRFPRVELAHLPTRVEPMRRLGTVLGLDALWVKRDDCTGLGLGGNKVRKLEFDLAAAMKEGADCIVCGGVVQSNTAR
jgi:AAA domain